MLISEFGAGLFESLPGKWESRSRPFVCDGSPLTCRTFIVGYNAANNLGAFRQFWSDEDGFNKLLFEKKYVDSGKSLENRAANRYWIRNISHAVGNCLETNIYSTSSENAYSLPLSARTSETFDYLFRTIKPENVFCYNQKTLKFFQKRLGKTIPLISEGGMPAQASMFGHSFRIVGHNHGWLSRAKPYVDNLIEALRLNPRGET